ncbi:MAG: recombinase XerC, partial [Micavibrio sp.]|nr:recombinase XerC [Micavibrio sp.]
MTIKQDTIAICAPDLAKTLQDWQDYLIHEKNVSKHTLRAYSADVTHFITFLHLHYAKPPSLNDLS